MTHQEIIEKIYDAFNNRDIEGVLTHFHPEVEWPNGWEGGYVNGHEEVRSYWTRQWQEIDPSVTPAELPFLDDGFIVVAVKQTVKNLQGEVVADGLVKHIYQFDGPVIRRMRIELC